MILIISKLQKNNFCKLNYVFLLLSLRSLIDGVCGIVGVVEKNVKN